MLGSSQKLYEMLGISGNFLEVPRCWTHLASFSKSLGNSQKFWELGYNFHLFDPSQSFQNFPELIRIAQNFLELPRTSKNRTELSVTLKQTSLL